MLDTICAQKAEVPVTSGYAGLLGIFCINLSFAVVTERRHKGVAFGDAGDKRLLRLTRVSSIAIVPGGLAFKNLQ